MNLPHARPLRVLDPACGSGELLAGRSARARSRRRTPLCLSGFESDSQAIARAAQRLGGEPGDELQLNHGDFLEAPVEEPLHDLIVADPPFVRTQVLGSTRAQALARRFRPRGPGRPLPGLRAGDDGLACARWRARPGCAQPAELPWRSSASIRRLLENRYDLLRLIDLGDTRLFSAAVLPLLVVGAGGMTAGNLTATRRHPSAASRGFTRIDKPRASPAQRIPPYWPQRKTPWREAAGWASEPM